MTVLLSMDPQQGPRVLGKATAPSDLLRDPTPRRCDTQPTLQTPSSSSCRMGVPKPDVQLHRGGPCCAESANPTPAIDRLTVLLLLAVPSAPKAASLLFFSCCCWSAAGPSPLLGVLTCRLRSLSSSSCTAFPLLVRVSWWCSCSGWFRCRCWRPFFPVFCLIPCWP